MIIGTWSKDQQNLITFVMVDAANTEVPGLGGTFTLEISKAGGAFVVGAGTKAEISDGWYRYLSTAAEADTIGPVSILVTAPGTVQQNLEYYIITRAAGAIAYTYVVTDSVTGFPIEGVEVWVSTDALGSNVIWAGTTDAAGIAKDDLDQLPWLDAGTYFFWKQRVGMIDDQNPDTEVVS